MNAVNQGIPVSECRKSTGQVIQEIRQHGMSIKRASELFTSVSPIVVAVFRIGALAALFAMFYLKTVFPTKQEIADLYGKMPAAVEKLTEIAGQQQKINEEYRVANIPNRIAALEVVAKENRDVNSAQSAQLNATDKQLAVIITQQAEIVRQLDQSNRRLEKIADKIGSP